jgi:hypothetical protein
VQAWSSLTDANINILRFKIWVDLVGFPIECMHEDEVVSVVSHFGTYLGTLEREGPRELCVWSEVLATTDLALVSKTESFMVGGLETIVEFWARLWISRSIYIATELPQSPLKYRSPTLCRSNY